MIKINGEWAIVIRKVEGGRIIRFEEDRTNREYFLDNSGKCSILK